MVTAKEETPVAAANQTGAQRGFDKPFFHQLYGLMFDVTSASRLAEVNISQSIAHCSCPASKQSWKALYQIRAAREAGKDALAMLDPYSRGIRL